ncbi:unnamed protein product [Urochloa humidicola]
MKAWDELAPAAPLPPRWAPLMPFLLHLGEGKFCVARMFDVDTFVVLLPGEDHQCASAEERSGIRMIRHKSRRYSIACCIARLL